MSLYKGVDELQMCTLIKDIAEICLGDGKRSEHEANVSLENIAIGLLKRGYRKDIK